MKYPPRITLEIRGRFPRINPCDDVIGLDGFKAETVKEIELLQERYKLIGQPDQGAFCEGGCDDSNTLNISMECSYPDNLKLVPPNRKSMDVYIHHYLQW